MDFHFLGAESSIENHFKSSRSTKSIFCVVSHLIKAKLFSMSMSTIWALCGHWLPWFSTTTWLPACRPSSDNTLLCSMRSFFFAPYLSVIVQLEARFTRQLHSPCIQSSSPTMSSIWSRVTRWDESLVSVAASYITSSLEFLNVMVEFSM